MYWRRFAVFFGSVVLCSAVGMGVTDAFASADQAATYGFIAGAGLGAILVAFVRD